MIKHFFITFSIIVFLICCSSKKNNQLSELENDLISPEEIYVDAMTYFNNENFVLADQEFKRIVKLFPLSNEAIQSEIMIGFIKYALMNYDEAIFQFSKIINKYPSHKNLDYIYYMVAMSNYEQIAHHQLDGRYNELSLEAFNQVIIRFPDSKYSKDSAQKIILVKTNKAAKHMEIGRFYLKEKKYIAALNRFKTVIEEYDETKFTPEALHRMVESYYAIGMTEEAIQTAAVLGHNYPNSKWYRYSYNLINENEIEESFIKKISNIFN